ncbi:MAG: acetate/propionate family kinase [Acetobacteraceae bacterium]|nr:acetate/propionate family kinase [Acetobacteraceae bacterium]
MSDTSRTPAQQAAVGVINAGSSSVKFALYTGDEAIVRGEVDGLGVQPGVRVAGPNGQPLPPFALGPKPPTTPSGVIPLLLSWLREHLGHLKIAGVGHRVVHGGTRFTRPTVVTPEVLKDLEELIPLAPLHEPFNLAPIKAALDAHGDIPQVACFDTSFHRTNPEVAQTYALPLDMREQGIRRYGFHGSSYEYIASVLPKVAPSIADGRVVVMHLGNGASACALQARVSVTSTMGFTAVEGLPMGTRCGALDPGVILHLAMQRGMSMLEIQDLIYKKSGMLGVSGISNDFRELLASSDPRASFAVEFFCYWVARHIGSLVAAMGGLDGLVFTAGVGEHAAPVRAKICQLCSWLGVELDEAANEHHGPRISRDASRTEAWVIPTNEERMIARHTQALLKP